MTSRTSRRRLGFAVAALAVAVAVGAGAAAAWPAGAAPGATHGAARGAVSAARLALTADTKRTLIPLKLPSRATIKPDAKPMVVSDTCATVRAHLKRYAARHIRRVSCMTVALAPAPAPARGKDRPDIAKAPVIPLCYNTSHIWEFNRTQECIQNATLVDRVYDPTTGKTYGTATFSVNQSITASTVSNSIVEDDVFTETAADGEANTLSTMELTAACGPPCRVTVGAATNYPTQIGTSQDVHISYVDTPATGTQDNFTTSYTAYLNVPNTTFLNNGTWSTPNTIRCDNQLTGRGVGCVFPGYTPTLALSEATYGAAAVNVWIGENLLAGTPGLTAATPLTRGNPAQTSSNRAAICDSTFIYLYMLVPTDSCDEYPFASTQQSGGANNLTGLSCLETMPTYQNGAWYIVAFQNYTIGKLRCERGHVPVALNRAVGSQALGPLYTLNRMLPGDPFVIQVTS